MLLSSICRAKEVMDSVLVLAQLSLIAVCLSLISLLLLALLYCTHTHTLPLSLSILCCISYPIPTSVLRGQIYLIAYQLLDFQLLVSVQKVSVRAATYVQYTYKHTFAPLKHTHLHTHTCIWVFCFCFLIRI